MCSEAVMQGDLLHERPPHNVTDEIVNHSSRKPNCYRSFRKVRASVS